MKIDKAEKRDKARNKSRNGMVVSNKSIFTVVSTIVKKGKKSRGGK